MLTSDGARVAVKYVSENLDVLLPFPPLYETAFKDQAEPTAHAVTHASLCPSGEYAAAVFRCTDTASAADIASFGGAQHLHLVVWRASRKRAAGSCRGPSA